MNVSLNDGSVEVSVIVCSYNGGRKIAGALEALCAQVASIPFEVIVVDDGSTDDTQDVAARYEVRIVAQRPNGGLSAARNAGIAAARAQILAFCDDDCVPGPTWVQTLYERWQRVGATVVGVGGHTAPTDTGTWCLRYTDVHNPLAPLELSLTAHPGLIGRLRLYLRGPQTVVGERAVYSLVGANMSFRAAAVHDVGLFDPVIRFGGDEEDLCRRLRARFGDHCLIADSTIVMGHDFERTAGDTMRRARAYGRGNGRSFARSGGLPPLRPLPLAALGVALVTSPFSVWPGLGAWVVLPLVVYRRLLSDGWRRYGAEACTYPYIAAAAEVANTIGFAQGWWRWRRRDAAIRVGTV